MANNKNKNKNVRKNILINWRALENPNLEGFDKLKDYGDFG